MKQLVLIAVLLLGTASCDAFDLWEEACSNGVYSCEGIEKPNVEWYTQGKNDKDVVLWGYYDGTNTIYLNTLLKEKGKRFTYEVIYHEMIHYLQKKVGGANIPGYVWEICDLEAEAFMLTDKWLVEQGWDEEIMGPDWWANDRYPQCEPYYNPEWTPPDGDFLIWIL